MSEKLLQFCFPDLNEKTKELADENTYAYFFDFSSGRSVYAHCDIGL